MSDTQPISIERGICHACPREIDDSPPICDVHGADHMEYSCSNHADRMGGVLTLDEVASAREKRPIYKCDLCGPATSHALPDPHGT